MDYLCSSNQNGERLCIIYLQTLILEVELNDF